MVWSRKKTSDKAQVVRWTSPRPHRMCCGGPSGNSTWRTAVVSLWLSSAGYGWACHIMWPKMTQVFLAVSHQLRFPSQIQLPTGNLMFNLDPAAPRDSHDGIWHAGYSPGFPGSNNTPELLMSWNVMKEYDWKIDSLLTLTFITPQVE